MGVITYFFDTYVLYEIIKGSPAYQKFVSGIGIIITKLNLMEFYYGLLKNNKDEADKYYDELVKYAVDIDDETIKKAMVFRWENRKNNLSYIDCIGYMIALERNIKFLTGDNAFKNLPNVEFVK